MQHSSFQCYGPTGAIKLAEFMERSEDVSSQWSETISGSTIHEEFSFTTQKAHLHKDGSHMNCLKRGLIAS